MSLAVEIVFKYMSIEPVFIWKKLIESHVNAISSDERGALYDSEITFSDVEKAIKKRGKSHFHIEFKNAVFQCGAVGNHDLSFILIEKCIKDLEDANSWIKPFFGFDSFIQGRAYDKEYDYWQNASDPLEYKSAGKSYEHLPMKSNDLPPPLEQKVIDTSKNPGRRILRDGYVEAIGSIMWFSKLFWQFTATKKESVLNTKWLSCKQEQYDILFIKAQDSLFNNSGGSEGKLQENLRTLLFFKKPTR